MAALFAMLFQTTIHILSFSFDIFQEGISIELIEDLGEKDLEEETDTEKTEWLSDFQDGKQIAMIKKGNTNNKLQITGALPLEINSPPPERFST